MHTLSQLCESFSLDPGDILNVYSYGSRIYGTNTPESDYDYIVVYKGAFLNDGSFKQNARSNEDRTIQIINFSRSGFKAGLENYEINCIECLFLPEEKIIQKKWPYKLDKINDKEFVNKIISKVSESWHSASVALTDGNLEHAKRGFYHSMRILNFAQQLKDNKFTGLDFSTAKQIRERFDQVNEEDFKSFVKTILYKERDQQFEQLRK